MLNADVLDDLQRYANAGSFRIQPPARLRMLHLPERVALGHHVRLRWHAEHCAFVFLSAPGVPRQQLPPIGEHALLASAPGQWPICIELWTEDDADAGLPGTVEERFVAVVPAPLQLRSGQNRLQGPPGSIHRVAWSIRGAQRAYLQHAQRQINVDFASSLDLVIPPVSDFVLLCAIGADGSRAQLRWSLEPTSPQAPSRLDLSTLFEPLPEIA